MIRKIEGTPFMVVNETADDRWKQIVEEGDSGVWRLAERYHMIQHLVKWGQREALETDLWLLDRENERRCLNLRRMPLKGIGIKFGQEEFWIGLSYMTGQDGDGQIDSPIGTVLKSTKQTISRLATSAAGITF